MSPSSPASPTAPLPTRTHEHGWTTESAHRTSDGIVRYVRCAGCGTRRIDLQATGSCPPVAQSTEIRQPISPG
ncbi:hypothetical protein ABC195_00860 [Microbacterium sp. 2P01SA-2]|uniref:hypothetical protein n=1 Tax=unclassified Microbacterium TaxID=2609290 RepID=UPI0039A1D433